MGKVTVCTSEAHVKREVAKRLDQIGAFYFMPSASAFGKAGVSDFIGLYKGRFFAIETKFGSNKPTPLQVRFIEQVIEHGGYAMVINERNLDTVLAMSLGVR